MLRIDDRTFFFSVENADRARDRTNFTSYLEENGRAAFLASLAVGNTGTRFEP
jgi:hypothetical protein